MPGVAAYEKTFGELEPELRSGAPAWVHELRRRGMDRFRALGFPTLRDEEWRFTRTRPIAEVDFVPARAGRALDAATVVALTFDDRDSARVVLVNGRATAPAPVLPEGAWVGSLTAALAERGDRVRAILGRGVDLEHQRFAALNTAFLTDGVFIDIADGAVIERPIHIVHVTVPGEAPAMAHPRLVVAVGRNAHASVVESWVSTGEGPYFTNAVSELVCGENASLTHCKVQREGARAFHIALQHAVLASNSRFSTLAVSMGGALVRNDVHTVLNGEGIDARVDGLYLAGARQHVDNHTFIHHARPHCHSFELYKGVLDGHARGVFNGRIYVEPVAQKTDAKQENNCILLSDDARINSNPQLKIFADDVKCTHGAAIGKTDDDALFYLRSRGIPAQDARDLIVYAFASEVVERIEFEPLKQRLEKDVFDWLERARAARA